MENKKYQGILIIPIILILAFIIGTVEFKVENEEPINREEFDLSTRIDNLKALNADNEDKLQEMKEIIEELQPDEKIPLSLELQIHLKQECNKYEVDLNEALAIMETENPTFNPGLIHKNKNGTIDTGLFQVNSCRNDELKEMGIDNLKDPKQNITAGVFIISTLDKYSGHEKYMAYNMGEAGMKKAISRGIYSTGYSRKVKAKLGR